MSLLAAISTKEKAKYKNEVKKFGRQAYRDMKKNGHSESAARLQSAQAMSEYHEMTLRNSSYGLKDIPEDFKPKAKRKWLSINDILKK